MGEVINLRQRRKAQARAVKQQAAAAARALHGRTCTARDADAAEAERRKALLNGAKREDRPSPSGEG